MLNIYMCKDNDDIDSISDLRQSIKFSLFLCGIKIINDVASQKSWKGYISTDSCILLNKENGAVYK